MRREYAFGNEQRGIRRKKISFAGPSITQKEVDYVVDAVKNGWYETMQKDVEKFEKTVANYVGRKYSLATHCCTVALHLACAALGLKEGDEVICTDFSWQSTAYSISYTGAKPVFVDIEPDTWCIDPAKIEEAITPKTKAIMIVHNFGHPCDMGRIMDIAKKHGLKVIEDAAPALGAEYYGKKVGSFGDIACFSFQGGKLAVCGEGGMILTDDEGLFKKIALLASTGRTDSKCTFWTEMLGYQYTMSNLAASLALAQVERIEELVEIKRRVFCWYYERLKNIPGIRIIKEKPGCKSNYAYPSILLEDSIAANRDEILKKFKEEYNIHARPGWPRMSQFPFYQAMENPTPAEANPVAESVWRRGISLPSAANITKEDVDFVCDMLINMISPGKNNGSENK